uniref:Uncharacterized protein n=1 Tax=Arion vulgaris TaxID=1028688 RepID=A0A0B7AT64_9EUPU
MSMMLDEVGELARDRKLFRQAGMNVTFCKGMLLLELSVVSVCSGSELDNNPSGTG